MRSEFRISFCLLTYGLVPNRRILRRMVGPPSRHTSPHIDRRRRRRLREQLALHVRLLTTTADDPQRASERASVAIACQSLVANAPTQARPTSRPSVTRPRVMSGASSASRNLGMNCAVDNERILPTAQTASAERLRHFLANTRRFKPRFSAVVGV